MINERTIVSELARLESDAREIVSAAISGASPSVLLERAIREGALASVDQHERVLALACGKASMPMASTLMSVIGESVHAGLVTVPDDGAISGSLSPLEVMVSSHPVPDDRSEAAGRRALELAHGVREEDLLIVLLSGGASALWSVPADGLTLEHLQQSVTTLLRSGADIEEMNTVRKHISAIKGGRLAAAAAPGSVVTLMISDVAGDDPSTIGSGPTVPDSTTYADALHVLERRGGRSAYPNAVVAHLDAGARGKNEESPGPGDDVFRSTEARVIGSNADALEAAAKKASELEYETVIAPRPVTGEASDVGRRLAQQLMDTPARRPTCLIWGGESTVKVTGTGRGGRNQEMALAAVIELSGCARPAVLLSAGTDGVDGPTDAAGAVASSRTHMHAKRLGLDAAAFLANNDSNSFFEAAGGLIKTGPTQTNVMDVQIGLIGTGRTD
ncbi:MAG: glycerate kinase [Rhodothermales bacterium]|nr:glycerate kinase [Rhodothermales bacterium]